MPIPRRVVAMIAASVMSVTVLQASATAQTGQPAPVPPALDWRACEGGFECASLDVPVDYAAPDGEQVAISLVRHPAPQDGQRIGSLVINFGGPGNAGTETLRFFYDLLPEEVRQRFDIVSFDPRGVGSSRPIDCVDDQTFERLLEEDPTPDSPADLPHFYDGSNSAIDFYQVCADKVGSWLTAVGSRNVARDLDRIRAALGDRKLTFLGYSYGTVIGAVYAQMFPKRVRTMVLDAAVNLSESPESAQVGNLRGFEGALDALLDDCAARPACAFHSGGDPRAALQNLRDRFEAGLTVPTRDGRTAGESIFYLALLGALYDRQSGWPILATALHDVVERDDGTVLARISDTQTGRREDGTYSNLKEAIGFIACNDNPEPLVSLAEYQSAFERYSQEFPFFGRVIASYPLGCDPRIPKPPPGAALDDVRTTKAPPILVIGNTGDPATPYGGARDLHRRLRGSRLLTFESTEHGSYAKGITCIDDAVDRYLVDRTLPARGLRCRS